MPSEKRARQRSAREAKVAALERQRRRRTTVRRAVMIVVLVGAAVGIFTLASGGSPKSTASSSTTAAKANAHQAAQAAANRASAAAGCPSSPTATLQKPKWSKAPAMTIDKAKTYTATVKTDLGTFAIALDTAQAPLTVNNFVFLANHGFYNCVIFHRVIPGFMDQTGDPTGTGTGGPGYTFADELAPKATPQYPIGSVAMANSGPNTNGSQFFIVTGPQGESLPDSYSLFGHVTAGMSVVNKINADGNASPSASGVPPAVVHRMLKVTISSS